MDFDFGWILLGLPLAFVLGWIASRLDLRQIRFQNRSAPKSYFRGLNYLLNEQQDQAIDAFIEAVQSDPDTSELHFALGNLFRRRGEYQRAVRVHEHLLSRGDLSQSDRHRAQHALALDFLKAGLLDRAEEALHKLEGTAFEQEARLALLANYERSRDWTKATEVASRLEHAGQGSFALRRAHYLCEQATDADKHGNDAVARQLLQQAIDQAPDSTRAQLAWAHLLVQQGQLTQALQALLQALDQIPASAPLIAGPLADVSLKLQQTAEPFARLLAHYERYPGLDVLEALIRVAPGNTPLTERELYARHLERTPSLVAATRWIAQERLEHEQFHPQVQRALNQAVLPLLRYRCAACGFEASQHFWQCPGCQAWDSYPARRVEEL